MDSITISDWLIVTATLLSPLIAVQVTRFLDSRNEARARKISVFKTLMSTRAYALSWTHVEALNRIDLEFGKGSKKERSVIEAWKAYHDILSNNQMSPEQWGSKRIDLLVDLLHKMAIVLDYDFDKTHIKNSSYAPRIHSETDAQQEAIRKGVVEVLSGDRELRLHVTNFPE
ncbi:MULTISPECIES: DUF6680 family protein [Comamonas]|uniref:DUF6680 family protein n=1 Tax=Comamonas TaxID=283 RepID=UPI000637771D|nr:MULTISPECIES: DUF6680 family protein [Comamonas]GAO72965.1 peptide chain release factor 1 [Comamonas sp. E6]